MTRFLVEAVHTVDELCLHLLDPASLEIVNELVRRAEITPDRIVEAAP